MKSGISFKAVQIDDAALILSWRQDKDVSKYMFSDVDDMNIDRQQAWIDSKNEDVTYQHYIMRYDEEPFGYISFNQIDWSNKHCSSGSYIVSAHDRRRFGGLLHNYFSDYIFYGLGMNKSVVEILQGNDAVIAIQKRLKLRHVGVFKDHVIKNGKFYDVELFELLEADYRTHPRLQSIEKSLAAYDYERNDYDNT